MSNSSTAPFERSSIESAAARIAPYIRRTPVLAMRVGEQILNLKLEYLQVSGTFKARGAFNRLLSAPSAALANGVVAASGGNHGIAVAYAASQLGVPAHIFVPSVSPMAKRERLITLGAHLRVCGEQYADALAESDTFVERTGALRSHAYDQAETLAGQGTIAREWHEQEPGLDTVLVAVGGGGLIGGIAAWFDGRVKVVAVESEGCPTLFSALRAGAPVDVEVGGLAADSLGARRVGQLMFPIARQRVSEALLVSDNDIRRAQQYLWQNARIPSEPGGAAAMAAVLSGAYRGRSGERIGVLVCGANVDPVAFSQAAPD